LENIWEIQNVITKNHLTNEKAEFIHRHPSPKRKDMEGRHLKKLKYWRKVDTLKDDW